MKALLAAFAALLTGLSLFAVDADAARTGGGRSLGAQRHYSPPPQRQAAPVARPQAPAAAPAARPSYWPSMLGGLAIGGLLGSMLGAGGGLVGLVLLALLVTGVVMLFGKLLRRPQPPPKPVEEDPWPTTRR